MEINEEALLKIGFLKRRYRDIEYDELHKGKADPFQIIFFDDRKIYLLSADVCQELPECRTVEDVEHLVRILNIK